MTKIHILAPAPISTAYLSILAVQFPEVSFSIGTTLEDVGEGFGNSDALFTLSDLLKPDWLQDTDCIRWIQVLGSGLDGIIDNPDLDDGVIISTMKEVVAPLVSEHAMMLMLSLSRKLPKSILNQSVRKWERWPSGVLQNKTVGLLGTGSISEALAKRCKAFDMEIVGLTSSPRQLTNFDRVVRRTELLEVAPEFDYLVTLVPLNEETRCLVDNRVFAAMKPSAFFINVARGGVVDEKALIEALDTGEIAGAGVDVFEQEPLPADSPLWSQTGLLLTPHLAGFSNVHVELTLPILTHNIRAFLDGRENTMHNLVSRK